MSRRKQKTTFDKVTEFIFGERLTPEEQIKKWRRELRRESSALDRQIRGITREENKIKREIKLCAKRGDVSNARTLAGEIVHSRKAQDRLHVSKAQLNSVSLQLQQSLSTYKTMGCLKRSAQIMNGMNNLIKLPQLNAIMMAMAREMEKSGLIGEMVDEMFEDPDEESEAEEEVEKILDELNLDFKDQAPNLAGKNLKGKDELVEPEKPDAELEMMQNRLKALKEAQ